MQENTQVFFNLEKKRSAAMAQTPVFAHAKFIIRWL